MLLHAIGTGREEEEEDRLYDSRVVFDHIQFECSDFISQLLNALFTDSVWRMTIGRTNSAGLSLSLPPSLSLDTTRLTKKGIDDSCRREAFVEITSSAGGHGGSVRIPSNIEHEQWENRARVPHPREQKEDS